MPENQQPTDIEQNVIIRLRTVIEGADAANHIKRIEQITRKATKSLDRLQRSVRKITGEFTKYDRVAKRSVTSQTKAIQKQKQLVVSLRQSTRSLRKQRRELRATTTQTQKATKATQGLFSSLRSVGALLGIGGVGFLAVNRIRSVIDKRFNLALAAGPAQITALKALTGGRNTTAAIDLAANFQAQSDFARFGIGGAGNKGLIAAQRALEKVGLDRANEILLKVTESLEPENLRRFLRDAESGDIRGALLRSASGQNIGAVTTALNALDVTQQADKGTLDPLLKVATDFADLGNRTADSFDRLTDTIVKDLSPHISALTDVMGDLVQRLGGLSTGQLLGGLAAGYLGLQGTKAIGKAALRRALGRGAGGAATRLLPRLLPAGGAGAAGAGGAAAVPAAALAIPAALAVGGGIAGDKINRDTIRLMEQAQRQDADNRLAVVARANRDNAKNRREMLIAKRQQLAFMASQTSSPVVDDDSSFLDRTLRFVGLVPDLPDQSRQLRQIQEQMQRVNAEIAEIDAGLAENTPVAKEQPQSRPVVKLFDWIRKGADAAKRGVDALAKTMKKLEAKALEQRFKRLQEQAAKRAQLELTASEQGSLTQLRRIEFAIASTSPFGVAASRQEMESLLASIRDEIGALEEILGNIDVSTAAGRIESNKIKSEIAQLRLEEKQVNKSFLEALKGLAVSEVLNAGGAFKKIILTHDNALAMALQKNIFKQIDEVTGSVGPSKGLKPRTIQSLLQEQERNKVVPAKRGQTKGTLVAQKREQLKQIQGFAEQLENELQLLEGLEEPDFPEQFRPTRTSGRTSLGTR